MVAAAGYFVFPVRPWHKTPDVRDWENEATRDAIKIGRWWRTRPYNIGIATGPSELVVVDLDQSKGGQAPAPFTGARNGRDVLTQLAAAAGAPVPTDTFIVETPSGGLHLYFQAPLDVELRNTQAKLGWRIDTRAGGGYVVAAGSIRTDGRRYRVCEPLRPVRELPEFLLEALRPPPPPPVRPPGPLRVPPGQDAGRGPGYGVHDLAAYMQTVVTGEAAKVANAPQGQSHEVLRNAALRLGNYVGGGALAEDDARAALLAAGTAHFGRWRCDCTEAEVLRTIDFGLCSGRLRPLHPEDRLRRPPDRLHDRAEESEHVVRSDGA
jgi:hypothetical protein